MILSQIEINMEPSADIANTEKPLASTPTYHGLSQSRQVQSTPMQQRLGETPRQEAWSACTCTAEQRSIAEAQGVLEELERDMAEGILQDINSKTSPPASMTTTTKPLVFTQLPHDKHPQPCQWQPAAIEKWLKETPHEEPWHTCSRTSPVFQLRGPGTTEGAGIQHEIGYNSLIVSVKWEDELWVGQKFLWCFRDNWSTGIVFRYIFFVVWATSCPCHSHYLNSMSS
jgi:hypothetical protein